jgi:hypothetical protein
MPFNEPDGSPAESPSVDDLPSGVGSEGNKSSELPPDFSGKSGNRDKARLEILGLVVSYAWGRRDTPTTPLRGGYSGFSDAL